LHDINHVFGRRTILQCVHTREIFEHLAKIGVDYAQGVAAPVPLTRSHTKRNGAAAWDAA
jgi:hypothetical protein